MVKFIIDCNQLVHTTAHHLTGSGLSLEDITDYISKYIEHTCNKYSISPKACELVFDSKNNWRYSVYPDYKANRKEKRKDPLVQEAFEHFNRNKSSLPFKKIEHDFLEADDIIAERVRYHFSEGRSCIIWSTDRDLNQLLDVDMKESCYVIQLGGRATSPICYYHPKMEKLIAKMNKSCSELFDEKPYELRSIELIEEACEVKCIDPKEVVFTKVISGDRGDNVPSVWKTSKGRGIGEVTIGRMWERWNELHPNKEMNWNSKDFHDELSMFILEYMKQDINKESVSKLSESLRVNIKLTRLNNRHLPKAILESYRNNHTHVI